MIWEKKHNFVEHKDNDSLFNNFSEVVPKRLVFNQFPLCDPRIVDVAEWDRGYYCCCLC